jgi:hypothetical protein
MTSFVASGFGLPDGPIVLGSLTDGTAIVPSPNPLTRLHFFDGRLLKGDDLTVEQDAERTLAMLLAQSFGSGVAWGFDVGRTGEALAVSAGLAFDPAGHPLLLPSDITLSISDLLGSGSVATGSGDTTKTSAFGPCVLGLPVEVTVDPVASSTAYLLTVGWIEGYCGTMDVYGAACEAACISGTDRPYRVDGVVFRLRPLQLTSPLPTSASVLLTSTHLRSRIAAAYFADERTEAGVAISAASLASGAWCHGGAAPNGSEVPLALVVRFGTSTGFHDEWVARRERLDEPPARIGFDGRIAMRARAVWDAQVAQFQCQLSDRLGTGGLPSGTQRLIDGGIIEVPPCGYLPVDQGADVVAQVTAMMGAGVDLRFVPVPVDVIPHELETVQHRDRISLLSGLDDPTAKPPVDVLVPDGVAAAGTATGQLFRLDLSLDPGGKGDPVVFTGTARLSPRGTGFTLSAAGLSGVTSLEAARRFVSGIAAAAASADSRVPLKRTSGSAGSPNPDTLRAVAAQMTEFVNKVRSGERAALPSTNFTPDAAKPIAGRAALVVDRDPWSLELDDSAFVHLSIDAMTPVTNGTTASVDIIGELRLDASSGTGTAATRALRFTGQMSVTEGTDPAQLSTVDLATTVQRSDSGGGQQFLVQGAQDVLQLLRFGGTPFTILAEAGSGSQRDQLQLVADPTVADPNSALRQNADVALRLLRAARPLDSQFYERTQLATFGSISTGTPAMTSGRDWVAFRRRPPAPPVAAAPPRTVQVWVYAAQDADDAGRNAGLLLSGDGDSVPWQRVAAAAFDATSGALVTDPSVLQSGYTATGAAATLDFIGFGPANMPSGTTRTGVLLAALAPTAQPKPGVSPQQIAKPPAGFVDASTDGSVFLIAVPVPVETALLQVVVVDLTPNETTLKLYDLLQQSSPHRAELDAAIGDIATDVGRVGFTDGNPVGSEVQQVSDDAVALMRGMNNMRSLPVFWIDRDWAAQNPELAKQVLDVAGKLAQSIAAARQEQVSLRQVTGGVGTSPTPAVLIEGCELPPK